jgi:hypothetical protein
VVVHVSLIGFDIKKLVHDFCGWVFMAILSKFRNVLIMEALMELKIFLKNCNKLQKRPKYKWLE